jgi:hypothetical protein
MRRNPSFAITARAAVTTLFVTISFFLIVLGLSSVSARDRNHGGRKTIAPPKPALAVPTPFSGTYDPAVFPCASARHHFIVPAGQARILVQVSATVPTNDITMSLFFGPDPTPMLLHTEDTGTSSEAYNYQPPGGVPAGEYQVQICQTPNTSGVPQMAPFTYNGTFTYDDTAASTGCAALYGTLTPAPQDTGPKVGYEIYQPPGELTSVLVTSSGGRTVEYLGRNAIEPSIGANFSSGTINYKSDLEQLFIDFAPSCSLGAPAATWVNRPAMTSAFVDSDPISFTDRQTNRIFVSELTLLSPDTSKISFSDNDGLTWTSDQQAQGIASAVDHQTMGGGPYHFPIPPPPTYPNAVYYCSQDIAGAFCTRSDNGGLTFGGQVPIYAVAQCGGLHGHVKIGPDGTVYVPNRDCGGTQSVVVSQDNGITWTVRPVNACTKAAAPSVVGGGDDPACAVDGQGRVYFAFSNFGGGANVGFGVAISDDFGATWKNIYDVGAIYGLKNVCFPTAVAGDANRAAVAFYGSTTPQGPTTGDSNNGGFTGVWQLYVAHTFDGGKKWTTTNVTPTLPMQRSGLLRGGGADIVRNLADFFDITIDKDGRVVVGYGNGCDGGNCAQAPLAVDGSSAVKGNAYSATAAIARQSSGRRMLAAHDPASSTSVPGMPFLTQTRRTGNVARLMWNEADSGNSMINNYEILRSTTPGTETHLATVAGTQTGGTYDDSTATDPTKTYYYRVVANNSIGSSCANNEIAAPYIGDTCTGLIMHTNDPTHPESTGGGTAGQPPVPQLLIDYVAVGEPPSSPGKLMFKMKVSDLSTIPPNSRWRIAWDWWTAGNQLYYVGMKSDASSNVTFEYGTLADAGVPAVLVLQETPIATLPQGPTTANYSPDGTITMFVPKSGALGVGNPQTGDLLGAVGGKTITGDTPATENLERSTAFVDHTFIKGASDNTFPAATYTLVGNTSCAAAAIVPVGAVSRKTHPGAGTFDVDLPLTGAPGVECRAGGAPSGSHKVVIKFIAPVTVNGSTTPTPADVSVTGIATVSNVSVNGSEITVDLTGVANAQLITITVNNVSDGLHVGNAAVPMGILLGDVSSNRAVNSTDVSQTQVESGHFITFSNFRTDVTVNGQINSSDVSTVQVQSGTGF